MKLLTFENRTDWLDARRAYVCASEVPKLFGLFGSPLVLYAQKTKSAVNEGATIAMRWGILDQSAILTMARETLGLNVTAWPENVSVVADVDGVPMMATPDGLDTAAGVVYECKSFEVVTAEKMDAARLQVQAQMLVCGVTRGVILCRRGNRALAVEEVEADDAVRADIIARAKTFWACVRDGRLPEPIGVEGEADVIAEHFPEINDVTVEIPAAHIMELERVKEVKKKAEAEIERLEAEIRMLMGDAKCAKGGGYTVTRSRYERVSPCYVKAEAKALLEAAGIEYTGGGMAIVDTLRVKRDKGGK